MNKPDQTGNNRIRKLRDSDFDGALAALKRAAIKAQRRAIETSGSYAVYQDGKIVHVTKVMRLNEDESKVD